MKKESKKYKDKMVKRELFEAEVQQHPSTGNTSVLVDINDEDIVGME